MPYLTVRGMETEKLCEIGEDIRNIVSEVSGAPIEFVKLFCTPDVEILKGEVVPTAVNLNMFWLPRPQEKCDKLAAELGEFFKGHGHDYIELVFTEANPPKFYKGGKSCG